MGEQNYKVSRISHVVPQGGFPRDCMYHKATYAEDHVPDLDMAISKSLDVALDVLCTCGEHGRWQMYPSGTWRGPNTKRNSEATTMPHVLHNNCYSHEEKFKPKVPFTNTGAPATMIIV